ncbi:hypothetical protein [Streptomyces hyaluromycini]|uniref:hypothetical protein n=1 Tax=Streptomyces hyaluromycini TaxID=1377993 RepID=UPI000B5C5B93|nr:hypothetical protein [Streptomyces hyaluromycini]
MGIAISTTLFITAFFCIGAGITVATTSWTFPWLAGKVYRPRLWGAGYVLFGVVVLYHAVVALVHVDPTVDLVMTVVTTVTALAGLGMMGFAQRVGHGTRSPRTGPGATD